MLAPLALPKAPFMSALFSPFELKGVTLKNRIAVPPMCQYSAEDGRINDWHLSHYAALARGGAGLVIVELPPCLRKDASPRDVLACGVMSKFQEWQPSLLPSSKAVP